MNFSSAPDSGPSPIRLGIIGCGHIFQTIYAPIFRHFAREIQVTSLCDVRVEATTRAHHQFPEAVCYKSTSKLLAGQDVDAIVVLTKESQNALNAGLVLEKNLPVYLEKPPAVSLAELKILQHQEKESRGHVYTAFNRRHTPLPGWRVPLGLRRVHGQMSRVARPVESFPLTAAHLIDSAQYFAGSTFASASSVWEEASKSWRISGCLKNEVECDLAINPANGEHVESLVFEGDETWELFFPNPEADRHPHGYLSCNGKALSLPENQDALEAMGFTASFHTFLDLVKQGHWSQSPHQLASCEGTVALLEEMASQVASPSQESFSLKDAAIQEARVI